MKIMRLALIVCALVGAAGLAIPAFAADAPKDLVLKGDAKCTGCHDEADEPTGRSTMLELNPGVLAIATTRHGVKGDARTPTCTDCHGDSEKHLGYKGKDKPPSPDRSFRKKTATSAADRSDACMACHKGDKRTHWEGSQHASNDVGCNACHQVHTQHDKVRDKKTQGEVCFTCHKTERAQTHKMSTHPLAAGKVACSDCHNAHGSAGPKLMVKDSVNATCYTCHAEKRGPFLWSHASATDDCMNCHTPHGSNTTPLLKARPPFLCQQCHTDHGASLKNDASIAIPGTANTPISVSGLNGKYPTVMGNGRMCLNCHVMVHGSNAPNGAAFNR
jgi:DmsE family decaheme c-type cytochrome